MKKYLTIIGSRPQYIKLDNSFKTILVDTGQHYSPELKARKIRKPKYQLGETDLGKMVTKLVKILEKEKPDYVIVYGDTRSTLAGATAAVHEGVPIVHIEAGCRSYNNNMPEERIRKWVDETADIFMCPSEKTKEYLELQGKINVFNVGATQLDAMVKEVFPTKKPKDAYKYFVATVHRHENLNKYALKKIFRGMECDELIELYLHPHTRKVIKLDNIAVPKNVKLFKPLPYKEMINRIAFAKGVLTDSGGLQVETLFLGTPCITLRNETEWVETLDYNNVLVGTDTERIKYAIATTRRVLKRDLSYGEGNANKKIKLILESL